VLSASDRDEPRVQRSFDVGLRDDRQSDWGAQLASARGGLAALLGLRMAVWTALPLALLHALPADLVEGVIWGQGWQLGYDQPPLQAWLVGAVDWTFGYRRWAVFLTSQILVAVCLWAVWRLARSIVTPLGALVSVLLLEGVLYFNVGSPNLFPDLIELPAWALSVASLHRALRRGSPFDWAVLGLCLAAAAYGKYTSAVLAAVMVGFLLLEPEARRSWRSPGPYLCASVCLLLLAPHLAWAAHHRFPTVEHIRRVSHPTPGALDRALAFAGFALGQLPVAGWIAIPILALARGGSGPRLISLAGNPTRFDRRFVATLALGPLGLMLVGAAVGGIQFRIHWTYAMWNLAGLFAVVFLTPSVDASSLRRFRWAWLAVFLLAIGVYAGANGAASHAQLLATSEGSGSTRFAQVVDELHREARHGLGRLQREADFPSREVADAVTAGWHTRVGGRLAFVVGDKWVAGSIAFFSPDHPLALRDGRMEGSPWIDVGELRRRGGIVAWNPASDGGETEAALRQSFPSLEMQPPIAIAERPGASVPPLEIRWGIVRPALRSTPEQAP
jgi:hypothetical protein